MWNPFKNFKKIDYIIWISSIIIALASNIFAGKTEIINLVAAVVGLTSLIFAVKGNVWAPILMVVFSILYGIISYGFRYYGEMVTYLGMTLPISAWAAFTWAFNPSKDASVVKIRKMTKRLWLIVSIFAILITIIFYFILKYFNTPNLIFSTLSVTTSFYAAILTMLRSSYYPLFYAFNDIILIILWIFASMENMTYLPIVINFMVFLFNDSYTYVTWKKREKEQ